MADSPTSGYDVSIRDGDSFTLNGEEIRLWVSVAKFYNGYLDTE